MTLTKSRIERDLLKQFFGKMQLASRREGRMEYFKVTARSGLKIRELPSSGSRVLEAMPTGMRVRRLDKTLWNGDWYKVLAEFSDTYHVEGYSHRKFLIPQVLYS